MPASTTAQARAEDTLITWQQQQQQQQQQQHVQNILVADMRFAVTSAQALAADTLINCPTGSNISLCNSMFSNLLASSCWLL
jgi:hypothetical protein